MNQGGKLDKMLSTLPYPVEKDEIVIYMQQSGASSQLIAAIEQVLPDQMFKSAEDIKSIIRRGSQVNAKH